MKPREILMVVAILGLIALLIGTGRAYFGRDARSAAVQKPEMAVFETTTTSSAVPSARPAESNAADPSLAMAPVPNSSKSSSKVIHIVDAQRNVVPELVAAIRDLPRGYALFGELEERTIDQDSGGGLLVVELVLEVHLVERDADDATFEITARGSGVTAEQARRQALDRLANSLRERLAAVAED